MLRALVFGGLSLMLLGFGAAGWQYWRGVSPTGGSDSDNAPVEVSADDVQDWLISPLGGPVEAADVRAYLLQDRGVPERTLRVTLTAPIADLLQDGEVLPDPVYLEVMADIRAIRLAEGLCPELLATIAARCAVASARVVPGSVDTLRGKARFAVELSYSVKLDPAGLPDLALHVFETKEIALPPEIGSSAPTVSVALRALLDAAVLSCADPEIGLSCRVLRLTLDQGQGGPFVGRAMLGTLRPLPEAMRVAPEVTAVPKITPAPEG